LFKRAGVELVMVPSRGEPQAISDLMAGNVNFYFGNASILLPQRDHPAIKLLAVGTAQRLPSAPGPPTAPATMPGFVFASWNGFRLLVGECFGGAERPPPRHYREAPRRRDCHGQGAAGRGASVGARHSSRWADRRGGRGRLPEGSRELRGGRKGSRY